MKKTSHSFHSGSIPTLIIRLAIPNTLGLLVVSAYSLADSFFVAALGSDATAAVGVTFSLHVLMQAVGYTIGMGAGSLLAREMGRSNRKKASFMASLAFFVALSIGALITIGGLLFRTPILRFLGARGSVLEAALSYSVPLFLSAPAMCTSFVLSQLLRAEGRAIYAMVGLMTGSLLNIALDPILITLWGLGIAGASVATLISQTIGATVLLSAYLGKRKTIDLLWIKWHDLSRLPSILTAGLPSLLRQGLSGIAAILLNRTAAEVGSSSLSAISLVTRLFLLSFAFCLGLGQAMIPVVGYNTGADNPTRVKKAFSFSLIASTIVMLILSIPLFFFATPILRLFGAAEESLSIGSLALRAQSAVLVLHGVITCTILFLQVTGRVVMGSVLAGARQGIFFLPLIFLLPKFYDGVGLALAQPIADVLTFLLAIPFLILALGGVRKIKATRS